MEKYNNTTTIQEQKIDIEPRQTYNCSKCDKDSDTYYWDAITTTISWECPDGHKNSFTVQ